MPSRIEYVQTAIDHDVEEKPEQLVKIAAVGIKDGNEVIIGRERTRP